MFSALIFKPERYEIIKVTVAFILEEERKGY